MHVRPTKEESCQKWLMFSKLWTCYNETQDPVETNMTQMNHVITNRSEEDEIYPLTVKEIVEAQQADTTLKHFCKRNAVLDKGLELQLVESKVVYAIKVGLYYQSHCNGMQQCGITTIYSTMGIHVSRRQ